jgi:Fe-S oxidoreductase
MATRRKYSFFVENKALQVSHRPARFLEAFPTILEHSNYGLPLDVYTRLSTKCSRCAASCQLYQSTLDDRDIPCHRSELLFRIYRRYFTRAGILRARVFNSFSLTDDSIDELAEAVYRCTACRRCKSTCPMGIDHGLVTHLARWILSEINVIPKALLVATREQLEGVGNTSAIPVPALKDTCEFLEEEFEDIYKITDVKFPVDVEGAEYIFFPAVSDYLLEPDTLMGNAAVMHVTGASWTIGTGNYDGINYGLFYSDRMMERIVNKVVDEARRLKAQKILVGECGHATRSAWFVPTFCGPDAPEVVNFLQYTHAQFVAGKIPLKETRITEKVTYHDPCNIARNGRITEEPRELLNAICTDFVEMTPNRTQNYCCGGGGGMVSIDEIRKFRTGVMGKRKADQIRATGAKILVAPCANCKKQLKEVCEDNGLGDVEVVGLHDLLLKVIDFGEPRKEDDRQADASTAELESEAGGTT